jgi:hypothetical protein
VDIYTYSSKYRDAGRAKEIKKETTVNAACQGYLSACRRFGSPTYTDLPTSTDSLTVKTIISVSVMALKPLTVR